MLSPDIKKYFYQKVDKDYTGYLDNTKLNRLFKDAVYRVLNEKIINLTQKNYDEISFLLKVGQSYTPNQNKIILGLTPVVSVSITSPVVYTIVSGFPHGLITGDSVTISGVEGTTNANGTYSVTVLSPTSFTITVGSAVGTNTANTGSFYGAKQVSNYYKLATIKLSFANDKDYAISKAKSTTPIRVVFSGVNNIRSGEQVVITGVGGNTNANGTFYVDKINSTTVDLYSDSHLRTPVAFNATYTSGGILNPIIEGFATTLNSDNKLSDLAQGTTVYPKFEESEHSLVLYPTDYVCVNATLDYFVTPKEIDFNDVDTNYTLYYNDKFLLYLIESAAKIFTASIRDTEGCQLMDKETTQNK